MNPEAGLSQMRPPLPTPLFGVELTTTKTAAAVSAFSNTEDRQVVAPPLRPYTDAEVEAVERRHWSKLVQEGWFHQSAQCLRWDEEMMSRGSSYRTRSVAARTTVRTTATTALVLSLNLDLALWMNDGGGDDADGSDTERMDGPPLLPPPALRASRLYMWRSPALLPGYSRNILRELGQQLERQYRSLSKRSLMVSHCLNTKPADLIRGLSQCRENAGSRNKVILHYGGYGVPRPHGGSLFLLSPSGEPVKCSLSILHMQIGFPFVMVADCANAGSVLYHFLETRQNNEDDGDFAYRQYDTTIGASTSGDPDRSEKVLSTLGMYEGATSVSIEGTAANTAAGLRGLNTGPASPAPPFLRDDFFFIGATDDGELPHHPKLPSDILTSCLTTPVQMALLWFIVENARTANVHPLLLHLIPGVLEDKKTPLGHLYWAFVSITECIAWSSLPYALFMHLFREDVVVASLFRGLLLAERIIIALGGAVTVYPPLAPMNGHPMWDTLDNVIDRTLVSLHRAVLPVPPTALTPLEFREWLDWGVTKWRYEQGSMVLPSLEGRSLVVPNFLEEELRSLAAVIERITEQSFSCLTHTEPKQEEKQPQEKRDFLSRPATEPRKSKIGLHDNSPSFLRGGHRSYTCTGNKSSGTNSFPFMLRMPMLLQGLLVMAHRDKATELVCRLVDAGSPAVAVCAEVGIFNMALVHYWGRHDLCYLLPTLLFIYTKACYTDPSLADFTSKQRDEVVDACVKLLENPNRVPDESTGEPGAWQRNVLGGWADPEGQQLLAAALLAMLCLHSGEIRCRSRERGALRVCCDLLQKAITKSPQLLLLHQAKEERGRAAGTEGRPNVSFGNDHSSSELESDPVRASRYVLSLIALLLSLSWEGVAASSSPSSSSPPASSLFLSPSVAENAERKRSSSPSDDDDDCDNSSNDSNTVDNNNSNNHNNISVRRQLASVTKTLRLLLCASSSAVRGASMRAISVIMVSSPTDERTALRCIRIIEECSVVRRSPQEGNTNNRLEFVGALLVAIRWLTERLSVSTSMDQIRQALRCESKRIYHNMMAAHGQCCDVPMQKRENTEPAPVFAISSSCYRLPSSSSNTTMRGSGKERGGGSRRSNREEYLVGKLAWLTCQLAVVAHDPCPHVAAHARRVLEEDLSQLHVGRLFFIPVDAVAGGRPCSTATSRNSGIANFLSGVLSTFTSRGGKQVTRGDAHQGKRAPQNVGYGGVDVAGNYYYAHDADARDVNFSYAGCFANSGRIAVADMDLPLHTVSSHDNSMILSFVFAILSFLGDLLLVPLDDDDPRNSFNLEKDTCIHRYLRQLRDNLRHSKTSSCGFPDQTGGVSSFLLPPATPSVWSHSSSLMAIFSLDDNTKGRTPVLSPLANSSSGGCPDTPSVGARDRESIFQLLADKNNSSERNGRVQVLAFHPTERHFVTGTDQGLIQVWSFGSLEGLLPLSSYGGGISSFSTSNGATTHVALASSVATSTSSGEFCRPSVQFHALDVMMRQESIVPPSALPQYMYSTQQNALRGVGVFGLTGSGQTDTTSDSAPRRFGSFSQSEEGIRGVRGAEPLTGLHFVDAAYRTLLCAVSRSGSVYLFSGYTSERTIRRVTSFATMTQEESLRSHQCLSSYHAPAMLLHVSGADGSIASWDLNSEHKVLDSPGCGELLCSPSALASHPDDVFSFAVGAGSVYLYDLRNSSRATHVLPYPTVLRNPKEKDSPLDHGHQHHHHHQQQEQQQQQKKQSRRGLGDDNPLCLHIGFSCRYAHGLVTGYGGEKGVVMLWDDRNLCEPVHQVSVFDAGATSCSALNSVCFMDVQHYHHALITMSVTTDTLFVGDALGPSSAFVNRSHIRLKHQCSAAALHPVLPICGVASGGSVQLYGRKRILLPS